MVQKLMPDVGGRVGCYQGGVLTGIKFIGYGTYVGRVVPPAGRYGRYPEASGVMVAEVRLDTGETIYGSECWVMKEQAMKAGLAEHPDFQNITVQEAMEASRVL